MVQTIVMLNRLPYPPHLARVPIIAGSHHERLDGTGYPKVLSTADQDLLARIIAIADIFEALTASDRPYKRANTLSETSQIITDMARENHINADLLQLFLREGIHLEYARKCKQPGADGRYLNL
jgi:HD-GYP domain-containing protein (c-di-GMP phosphodiesterase class II)